MRSFTICWAMGSSIWILGAGGSRERYLAFTLVHGRGDVQNNEERGEKKPIVDLQDVFLRYMFDNTCNVIFGRNFGCLVVDIPQIMFAKDFHECVEVTFYRQIMPRLIWKTLHF